MFCIDLNVLPLQSADSDGLLVKDFTRNVQYPSLFGRLSKMVRSVTNYIRKRPLFVLFLLVLIVAIDLVIFYETMEGPKFNKIEMNFQTPKSDAQIQIQGEMSMSSATTSFAVNGGHCNYFYSKRENKPFVPSGRLEFEFPKNQNDNKNFGAHVDFQHTNYDSLRHIYWDFSSRLEANSSVKIECSIQLSATVYGMIPVKVSIPFTQIIAVRDLQDSTSNGGNKKKKNQIQPRVSVKTNAVTTDKVEMSIIVNIRDSKRKKMLRANNQPIDSFIVNLPKISYATAFLDKATEAKNFLKIRSHATSFDLAVPHTPIVIDLKISCTPAAQNGKEANKAKGQCSLLSPVNFGEFREELVHHKFVNITAQSLETSFISNFMGEYHYITSVDPSEYPGPAFNNDNVHNFQENSENNVENNNRQLTTTDPSISTGGNCVTVASDGVYISQLCSVVQAGFFKLYVGIYNNDGFVGYLNSATSWATSGEVAFESHLEGSITSSGTTDTVYGQSFFSENYQNLSLILGYNQTTSSGADKQYFLEALEAAWDFTGSSGLFDVRSLTLLSGFSPYRLLGMFLLLCDLCVLLFFFYCEFFCVFMRASHIHIT